MSERRLEFLVGDNPFHGISHLSQRRARLRAIEEKGSEIEHASEIVKMSLQNGATGFMFSVSDITLSILKKLDQSYKPDLYALVPYAYEYVRMATRTGGITGLAKKVARQIAFSSTITKTVLNIPGYIKIDPTAFLKTYLIYEIARLKSARKNANLKSIMLHEVITDMALALNLDQFFKSYINFLLKQEIQPGFETRNFVYLVNKFSEWKIDFSKIVLATPFNKIGFLMNPSKIECENALEKVSGAKVIAMSILAAGYIEPSKAIDYFLDLPNITHVVVGVSKEKHAIETFRLLRKVLESS